MNAAPATVSLQMEIFPDANAVARAAAEIIAADARAAVNTRGQYSLAVSGGRTPWIMLRALADEDVPWQALRLYQVDERLAPEGDPDRNLTHLRESLLDHVPLRPDQVHAMPVDSSDPQCAAKKYALIVPLFDLVHLGLGPDGHTASLVPGDPVLDITDSDVALTTGLYQGRRRMTLTYRAINRARRLLWVVTGRDKVPALGRLLKGDTAIPAGRVKREQALIVADHEAADQEAAA